jgi:MEDS: MEthanogen/methylotroph, DcmR Sensory domain
MGAKVKQIVDIDRFALAPGSAVIHFYYDRSERLRLLGFLWEGISRGQGVVLASTHEGYEELRRGLETLGVSGSARVIRVAITPDIRRTIDSIADATRLAARKFGKARVLADFDGMIGKESIFELEAALASALEGLNVIYVSQYDGNGFDASVTLEQFRSHALCIMGNAFYHENRNFTPPDSYFRKRAAGGQK